MPDISSPTKRTSLHEDYLYVEQIKCEEKLINSIFKQQNELFIKINKYDKVEGGAF
jgi:hypothetical protein